MNQDLLVLKINAVDTYTSFSIQPMLKDVLYNKHFLELTTVLSLMYTLLHYTPIRIICYKPDFH
jgi:hypothetical protein